MFSTVITLYIRNCSAYCLLHIYEKNLTNATEKHTANVLADSIIEVKLRFGVSNSQTPEKNLRKGMSSTGRTNQTAQKSIPCVVTYEQEGTQNQPVFTIVANTTA